MNSMKIVDGEEVPCSPEDLRQQELDARQSQEVPQMRAFTWKTDVWERVTDDEADALDAALRASPAKVRRFWDDSLRIWHDHEMFGPALKQPFADLFGDERAGAVFAPSGAE
jgi:Trm5-related predicted tRNA methylase